MVAKGIWSVKLFKGHIGLMADPLVIDVSRPSIWGNPYRIGTRGPDGKLMLDAGSTLGFYERWLRGRLKNDYDFYFKAKVLAAQLDSRHPLKIRLYCRGCGWDSSTCHARVLERILKEEFGDCQEIS